MYVYMYSLNNVMLTVGLLQPIPIDFIMDFILSPPAPPICFIMSIKLFCTRR